MSIRTRLTLWYSVVLLMIVAGLAAFVAWRLHADLISGLDASLRTRAQQVANVLQDPEDPEEKLDLEELAGPQTAGLISSGFVTQVVTPRGEVLTSVGEDVTDALVEPRRLPAHHTVTANGDEYRVLAVRLERTGNVLLVAASTAPAEEATRRLVLLLALAAPAAIVVSAAGGYLLAKRALLPVDRMTQTAAAIRGDDGTKRLDVPAIDDEIGRLGRTLNDMLDRLHRAMVEQRRFVSDASHELRTPLAIMQSEIDVALRSPSTPADARPVLASAREEVVRMTHLVEGLLTLAQADEGRLELASARVDLRDVASDACERLAARAAAKRVTIESNGTAEAAVWGDRMRLDQLVTNLVDNAVKHSPGEGTVQVGVRVDGDHAVVTVQDSGSGVSAADVHRIFDRFTRLDEARSRAEGGAGLGLAICRTIARAHGGDVTVAPANGTGAVFEVRLPLER